MAADEAEAFGIEPRWPCCPTPTSAAPQHVVPALKEAAEHSRIKAPDLPRWGNAR